jgi:hypothetical protein
LVAELQATRSPEAAVRRALGRVGEEVASILQRAHETAEKITAQSRSEAEERLETARREAKEITGGAHERVTELDSETDRIWAERHRIVEDARELARSLLTLADSAAERFPAAPEEAPAPEAAPALEDTAAPEPAEVEALDKWDDEELDNWDEDDEEQAGGREPGGELFSEPRDEVDQESEATTAMPPVDPAEPSPAPTEETRKLR